MWEGIEAGKDLPYDMSWVVEGTTNNSLAWITDGSYNRKKAIDLCRVGWIIFYHNRILLDRHLLGKIQLGKLM